MSRAEPNDADQDRLDEHVAFERIADLARHRFAADLAVIVLGDEIHTSRDRHGHCVPHADVRRFCRAVTAGDDPLVVTTAVRMRPTRPYRFAVGQKLFGVAGGALCLFAVDPRLGFPAADSAALADLATLACGEIEHRRLRLRNATMQGFADTTASALICTRADGTVTFMNKAAEVLLGYAPSELVGHDIARIVPDRFVAAHRKGVERVGAGGSSKLSGLTIEAVVLHREGTEITVDMSLNVWRDAGGVNYGASLRDITERKRREEGLKRLANYDALTGLARASRYREALADVLEAQGSATVMILNVEGLNEVGDALGRVTGDAMLQAIAIRLLATLPHGSKLARFDGELFAVLLPGERDPLHAAEVAHDIQMALAEPFEVDGHVVVVGATIGAAIAPVHAAGAEDLVAAADLALHNARTQRGQRFRLYDCAMQSAQAARQALRDSVRQGLATDEFVLHYQPQISFETGDIVGAEALMRWRHPTRGMLSPGIFIPVMDDSSLALQAGWWSLDQACRLIADRQRRRLPPLRVSVNLFAAQLRYGGLVSTVRDLIATYAMPPDQLELEIRETIANQDDAAVTAIMRDLRNLGVGIALDDFGTGYASLRTLKCLPVTTIKIDQSFVRDITSDAHDHAIVSAILAVGKSLSIDVVAEGIETRAQERVLRRLGCPIGQGFLYGRPGAATLLPGATAEFPARPSASA